MDRKSETSPIEKVKILITLMRPVDTMMVAAAILISIYASTGTFGSLWITIPALLAASLINGAGNTLNDYFDVDIDNINKPNKPLPSGKISARTVWSFAISLFILGLGFSLYLPLIPIIIAVINTILLALYAAQLKKSGFFGNILISYLVSSVFMFAAAAVGNIIVGAILGIAAFFTMAAREILKDLEDIKGDEVFGAKTLPLLIGVKNTIYLVSAFLITAILVSPFPYLLGVLSIYYLILAIITDIVFIYVIISMVKKPTIGNAALNQKKIKYGAMLGLLALLAGTVGL